MFLLRPDSQEGQDGFTLLEMVLAIGVAALLLHPMLTLLKSAVDRADARRSAYEATAVAESLLERLGHDFPLQTGTISGEADGWEWEVEATDASQDLGLGQSPTGIYHVEVSVAERRGDLPIISLVTLRIAQ